MSDIQSGGPGDRFGAVRWAQCPECGSWVQVGTRLIEAKTVEVFCPSCEHRYLPENAKTLI